MSFEERLREGTEEESLQARVEKQVERIILSESLDNIREISKNLDNPGLKKGIEVNKKYTRQLLKSYTSGSIISVTNDFNNLTYNLSILTLIGEALEPIFSVLGSLMDMFIGVIKESTAGAITELSTTLSSPSILKAVETLAMMVGEILLPIITGFGNFLKGIFGETGDLTPTQVGGAIGAVIGAVVGGGIGIATGFPWMGAIAGAWVGSMIGQAIGATFPENPIQIDIPEIRDEPLEGDVAKAIFTSTNPEQENIPQLAEGGIVTKPMFTGRKKQTSRVFPLEQMDEFGFKKNKNLELYTEIKDIIISNNIILKQKQERRY